MARRNNRRPADLRTKSVNLFDAGRALGGRKVRNPLIREELSRSALLSVGLTFFKPKPMLQSVARSARTQIDSQTSASGTAAQSGGEGSASARSQDGAAGE